MIPQRLVLFVEGKGDTAAVPTLARRVVSEIGANDALFVDGDPFVVRGLGKLVKNDCCNWQRWLRAAAKTRTNLGSVFLVLDGDLEQVPQTWKHYVSQHKSTQFCAYRVAASLAHEARAARAGEQFSVSVAFAMKEFETWLVAGVESLRGVMLAGDRAQLPLNATAPTGDVEAKRNAKGVLRELIPGYDPSLDQALLAGKVDLKIVARRCRSFGRFESAIKQLATAARASQPIVSPTLA